MYLVDSNIIIKGFDSYPPDRFPGYWDHINGQVKCGNFLFHTEVCSELSSRADVKSDWLKSMVPSSQRLSPLQSDFDSMKLLTEWALYQRQPNYLGWAVDEFLEIADSWIVATAHARGYKIISDETSSPRKINRVKIPDAASAFGVPCFTSIEYLRANSIAF